MGGDEPLKIEVWQCVVPCRVVGGSRRCGGAQLGGGAEGRSVRGGERSPAGGPGVGQSCRRHLDCGGQFERVGDGDEAVGHAGVPIV